MAAIHRFHRRQAFQEKLPGHLALRCRLKVERKVHAIFFQIHRYILREIGEL